MSRFDARRHEESSGEIIGRTEVLARLSEAWSDARDGKGRAVCLVGDAGIGKSRLAKATLDLATRDGATILSIDCMPSTGNTPLYPIGMLLRRIANITTRASPRTRSTSSRQALLARFMCRERRSRRTGLPRALCSAWRRRPFPPDQMPDQVRDQTISIVVRLLRALAGRDPSVLLCEDLHWADDTTARIIERLADEIGWTWRC